jgi:hypothetical protein
MTNFNIPHGECMVYSGKDNLAGAPLHFFIKNSLTSDIVHNEVYYATIRRIHYHNIDFMVGGVEIPNFKNWAGIEIIDLGEGAERGEYILYHLGTELTFEKPVESDESIWSQVMIVPGGDNKPHGIKMTLAILPENAKVILPLAAGDIQSKQHNFKRFGLIQDYIKFDQTPLLNL